MDSIARDNQISRDIISGKISELYCIKPSSTHTFGKKYAVWATKQYIERQPDGDYDYFMKIFIVGDNIAIEIKKDTNICYRFETSLKNVRKMTLNKLNGTN